MQDDKTLQTKAFIWQDGKAAERAPAPIEERISKRNARQEEQKRQETHQAYFRII